MIFNRKPSVNLLFFLAAVTFFPSCIPENKFLFVFNRTSVKHPIKDTAFVFNNEIKIKPGVVSKDEENRLESELDSYWDDTVKARTIQQFGLFYRIKTPQRFDTIGLRRSAIFMNAYMQSQGYFNAMLKDSFRIDTFRWGRNSQQLRAIPMMTIDPGKRTIIDSFSYNFTGTESPTPSDTLLQQLATNNIGQALIKKAAPYSRQLIGAELDRLVSIYREHGFYRLNRDHLAALVDTTDKLIDSLAIDPFELATRIEEAAARRRLNPTADVTIMQARQAKELPLDRSVLKQYYIGNVFYYPETNATTDIPDSLLAKNNFRVIGNDSIGIFMKHPNEKRRFRFRPFRQHTYVSKGEIYNERNFYRTINAFSQMGPWQQVDVRDSIRQDTVDLHVFLAPNPKATYKFDVELTRSTADFSSSTNLFGIGGNVSYIHRNVFRRAIQSVTTARAGVELNLEGDADLFQTIQAGVGQTFSFPNLLWPYTRWNLKKDFDAVRTLVNVNANYTDRRNFFRVRSLMLNMGYEYKKKNKIYSLRFPIPFIELYSLDTLDLLREEFKKNPFLRTAFNTGSVVGWAASFNATWPSRHNVKVTKHFRMGGEYAGLFLPWVNRSLEDNLYHYIKAEFEYIHKYQFYDNTVLVFRGFTGIGYNLIQDETLGRTLPFFKQFVAGGPNSMRAWGLRQLGLGSSLLSETTTGFSDRFGDLQVEGNIEYRFPLATIGGTKFNSAVFMDVGNIWNLKNDTANPEARFAVGDFYKDLAVALGVGLVRLNIANFILRVDFALKLKDPARQENGGWLFPNFKWKNGEYPQKTRNNYAIQLGIGLPF